MEYKVIIVPACFLLLGACTTYSTQNASNTDVEVAVVEEATSTEAAPTEVVAAVDQETEDSLNTIVCRRTMITGSRFKRKVCFTRRQWRDMSSRAQSDMDANQRMNTQTNNPQGG